MYCCISNNWNLFQQREILNEIQRREEEKREERKKKEIAKQVLCVSRCAKNIAVSSSLYCNGTCKNLQFSWTSFLIQGF